MIEIIKRMHNEKFEVLGYLEITPTNISGRGIIIFADGDTFLVCDGIVEPIRPFPLSSPEIINEDMFIPIGEDPDITIEHDDEDYTIFRTWSYDMAEVTVCHIKRLNAYAWTSSIKNLRFQLVSVQHLIFSSYEDELIVNGDGIYIYNSGDESDVVLCTNGHKYYLDAVPDKIFYIESDTIILTDEEYEKYAAVLTAAGVRPTIYSNEGWVFVVPTEVETKKVERIGNMLIVY